MGSNTDTYVYYRFVVDIYDNERQPMLEEMSKAKMLSVMIDGATDHAVLENEIAYVKFWDQQNGSIVQVFLGIEDVKNASAEGVIAALDIGK